MISDPPVYDANGNVTADGFHTYAWDAEGRTVTIDSGTFTYDALDRRLDFGASGSYQQYFYPPFDLNYNFGQAVGTSGQLGLRLPSPGGGQVTMAPSGVTGYRHPNWQGSQVVNSTTTRTVAADNAFTPFGERYAINGISGYFAGMLMQYPYMQDGYQADERLYHDGQGRWVSPDPAGLGAVDLANPQSLNRYVYVMNDPLDNVDPSGLMISTPTPAPPDFSSRFSFGVICNPDGDWSYTGTPGQTPCNSIVNQLIGGATLNWQSGGGHGGGAAGVPGSQNPGCPAYISNFFQKMVPVFNGMSQETKNTNPAFFAALSSYESGWLGSHAQDLRNPFGLTNAGGLDLKFGSYTAAANFWLFKAGRDRTGYARFVTGALTIAKFAAALQAAGYNNKTGSWAADVRNQFGSVQKWMGICHVSF